MEGIEWVDAKDGEVPENAVEGGADGEIKLFIGRAPLFGDLLPGRLTENGTCLLSYGGEEYNATEYQVLVQSEGLIFEWVATTEGNIPDNAVPGGNTEEGEALYIGRATHEEALLCGKVHPSHGVLYLAHCEKEHGIPEYEILVCKKAEDDADKGGEEEVTETPVESGEPPEDAEEPEA